MVRECLAEVRGKSVFDLYPLQNAADSIPLGSLFQSVQALEEFHKLAYDNSLVETVERLLGTEVFAHPAKLLRVIPPHRPDRTNAPHQDFPYVQGATDVVTAWIPLGDCPRQLGGLQVLPESHTHGLREMKAVQGDGGYGFDMPQEADWYSPDYKVGDVVFFHSHTIHAGTPNLTRAYRLSVDIRYQSATECIADCWTWPFGFNSAGGWRQVGSNWASLRWVSVPATARRTSRVEPGDDPSGWHRRLHPPPSRFF